MRLCATGAQETLARMTLRFLGLRLSLAALLGCAALAPAACVGSQTGEETSPGDCFADTDCPSGVCGGRYCMPGDLCATSDDCEAGFACHHSEYHCPYQTREEHCLDGRRGLCTRVEANCSADEECAEDQLCWAVARFDCAQSDPACDAAEPGVCTGSGRFCEPDDEELACSGQEACIDRRCTWLDAREEHDEIALDGAKNEELEPIFRSQRWDSGSPSGDCSAAPGQGTQLTPLLLLAALAALRAYRSARSLKRRSAS